MAFSQNILFMNISFLLLSAIILLQTASAAPDASLVKTLPGFNGIFPSKHYSGYVTLDTTPRKNLFYYFVVSERNASEDPVVLWLNGGPGCSSFDGFIYEHGPFNFEKGEKEGDLPILHLNPYSWSKASNIIYLDSPSGVGYSYPLLSTGDLQTANDTHAFLLKWFELYPEFEANPFYLSGESYGGIYIPTLAAAVDQGITAGVKPKINLKGYMIGNGVCDNKYDGDNSFVPFVHGMGIIPDQLFKEAENACKGNFDIEHESNDQCRELISKIYSLTNGLNIYDILEPCYHGTNNNTGLLPQSFKELGKTERPLPVRTRMFGRVWPYRAAVRDGIVPTWSQLTQSLRLQGFNVPCVNDEVATKYLNDKAVRDAMHVSPEVEEWSICSDVNYSHDTGSMIPYHKNLTAKGYRALIYSGDHDMCVPYTGSEAWTASLGYKIIDEWRSWNTNNQVSGYLQAYDRNLTFLTIKGAGHTVPEYKPAESLQFYSAWLQSLAI